MDVDPPIHGTEAGVQSVCVVSSVDFRSSDLPLHWQSRCCCGPIAPPPKLKMPTTAPRHPAQTPTTTAATTTANAVATAVGAIATATTVATIAKVIVPIVPPPSRN